MQEQGDNKRVKASTYFEAAEAQLRAPVKAAAPPSDGVKEVRPPFPPPPPPATATCKISTSLLRGSMLCSSRCLSSAVAVLL